MNDTFDPILEHLHARRQELLREIDLHSVRVAEVERLIEAYTDGRTKLGKQVRRRGGDGAASTTVTAGTAEMLVHVAGAAQGDGESGQ